MWEQARHLRQSSERNKKKSGLIIDRVSCCHDSHTVERPFSSQNIDGPRSNDSVGLQFSCHKSVTHLACGVCWRSRAWELLPVRRWKRRPVDGLAKRMCYDGGVSLMVWQSRFLVRARLEARCEELMSQTGNRPVTLSTMRKQLVDAAVTQLLWSRDGAERETVGQLRLALREPRQEEEELQPEREGGFEPKRSRNW